MEIQLEPTSNKLLVGDLQVLSALRRSGNENKQAWYSIYTVKWYIVGVAASFQRSRIHKPHAHTQAFKVKQRFIDWGDYTMADMNMPANDVLIKQAPAIAPPTRTDDHILPILPKKKRKLVKVTPDEPSPAKRSKASLVGKRRKPKSPLKLVNEFANEGVPIAEPRLDDEESDLQRGIELSLKDLEARNRGPARPMVFMKLDSGRFQPLLEVQGKGKEKVIEEQAAHDLLALHTPNKKSPVNQYIFQMRSPMTTGPSGNVESPSLDAELADSETEFDKTVTPINKEKDASNRELNEINAGVILEEPASSTGTLSSLQNLEKELIFTDQLFVEKPQEEELEKTNAESEVQSMVTVPIYQDTSLVPLMTTPVLDLPTSQSDSPTINAPRLTSTATTTTITTTTTTALPPSPPQLQFSSRGKVGQTWVSSVQLGESQYSTKNLDEARRKKRMKRNLPRTPFGSPPLQPPPPPPPAGASSTPRTSGASRSFWLSPPPPPSSTDINLGNQQHGSEALSSSKSAASTPQSMAWTISDTRYESDDRPATPEPAWTIPSSKVSDVENNWATALTSTYVPPAENSLLTKTGDMTTFFNWYSQEVPQDRDVSSATLCFFIHVIYAMSCLYIRSLSVMLSRISFHVLIRQGVTILVSEPGYETVGSKDLTCEDWMVNTRTDADLSTVVQNALQAILPRTREEIREEFRTRSGSSNAGGNPPPFFPRAEQEHLKMEYHSIRQTNTETNTEFMQRFLRLAGFLKAAAGIEEEKAKNFPWGLRRGKIAELDADEDVTLVDAEEDMNADVTPLFVKKTLCHNLGVISKHS
uniref:Zinc finger, CCHC-type, retrotransposon Gag domain protein n=1 Tax=Tanacetum cinerariifolium TaxID=118510 RepID=A0A6L2N7H8_TANCI|nr:zinc finger, CCHC-type, retrotransposon Gag domain protein [Tanacetum cinerariifolium]